MKKSIASTTTVTLGAVYLVPSAEDGLTLRSATQTLALRGEHVAKAFHEVLPLLDGTRTLEQVRTELGTRLEAGADSLVDQLVEIGVIEPVVDQTRPQLQSIGRFFEGYGGGQSTLDKLTAGSILVAGEGPALPSLALQVAAMGVPKITMAARTPVTATHRGQSAHLLNAEKGASFAEVTAELIKAAGIPTTVDAVEFPADVIGWRTLLEDVNAAAVMGDGPVISAPWLSEFNRAALMSEVRWTSGALMDRRIVHIGPSVVPHETACWQCFETRYLSHLGTLVRYEEFQRFAAERDEYVDMGGLPAFADIAGAMVAFELARVLDPRLWPGGASRVTTFNLWTYEMTSHDVLKLPRCPHCTSVSDVPSERVWA